MTRDDGGRAMNGKSYEDRLGDALEKLLGGGADDLAALSSGLNQLGIEPPDGVPWSADSLAAELRRLAA
jgi:hypothetical protein